MKAKFSIFIAILILYATLALVVNAHPGSTDSSGGHTDKSTSEYHYHHGYPEHDHYDKDGDGIRDCPYDFDNKTGQNSGSSSGSSHSSSGNSNLTKSDTTQSWLDNLVTFFRSPYGIFCIIAVILQVIFALILIFVEPPAKYFGILLLFDIILFISSIKISGPIVLACLVVYISAISLIYYILPILLCVLSMVYNGIKWLLSFLFSQR